METSTIIWIVILIGIMFLMHRFGGGCCGGGGHAKKKNDDKGKADGKDSCCESADEGHAEKKNGKDNATDDRAKHGCR